MRPWWIDSVPASSPAAAFKQWHTLDAPRQAVLTAKPRFPLARHCLNAAVRHPVCSRKLARGRIQESGTPLTLRVKQCEQPSAFPSAPSTNRPPPRHHRPRVGGALTDRLQPLAPINSPLRRRATSPAAHASQSEDPCRETGKHESSHLVQPAWERRAAEPNRCQSAWPAVRSRVRQNAGHRRVRASSATPAHSGECG